MSRGQWTFRNRQRTGSNIWLKTTSFIIAKRILGTYTCPILTFTPQSIAVMLYSGSIGRKSIIITVDPVTVKQRDISQRYVTSITNFAKTTAYKDYCNPRRGRGGGDGGTPDFKWWVWSNGGKNKNSQKSLGLPTQPPQNAWTNN